MPFKYRAFERKLTKLGYKIVRQKGSHVIFSDGKNTFPVPNHGSKDISPGVERQLLKILNLTINEFRKIK
ncbi:YcfA family protein [uncultured Gammaproteobacteria bacterium]|uniref:type II toxin-antitoxin system HicA family toxin n=1 Tax=Bathymodiolus heckerae thiotrophic gill symbiont TaxID=1052212 RepID=UPI0010B5DB05|nr:type II toxin-antitoxin system HicA family toxin [Bathymodiolus heckerae thiotrophic gill symbiont]CAC9447270.1 YcfA family protein [uncultured Gammaproteobacteria bacterium]SMN12982.1 YcfA family protein [Bathymodiolus heckerae thiotrophic gill symbiont]SMN14516.1 YcfA family protein [uncultured Candidatus Thioglobus sp.]